MSWFDSIVERGTSVAGMLTAAGMDPSAINAGRHFASRWGWEDDRQAYATIWEDDIRDFDGTPKWHVSDPRNRSDLVGPRRARAQDLFDILVRHAGEPVRVILQTRKKNPASWSSGVVDRRGLDPEPWFASVEGDTVHMQRGSLPGRKDVSVSGKPMPARKPAMALRETRPEQMLFRQRVSAKSGGCCALTGAPGKLCDAAHFPWAHWRTDNEAHHGILLRRDLHAALDCNYLSIDQVGNVLVNEFLADQFDEYRSLDGQRVPI
ncbi:MAG: HNH endonuclease [Pseudomonas sp.]